MPPARKCHAPSINPPCLFEQVTEHWFLIAYHHEKTSSNPGPYRCQYRIRMQVAGPYRCQCRGRGGRREWQVMALPAAVRVEVETKEAVQRRPTTADPRRRRPRQPLDQLFSRPVLDMGTGDPIWTVQIKSDGSYRPICGRGVEHKGRF